MFWGFQPTVLKASTTPTPVLPDWTVERDVAWISALSVAVTRTSPFAAMSPSSRSAVAAARMALVAITALTARSEPLPKALPPPDLTVLLMRAWMAAASSALTWTSPPAVTSTPWITASTPARTSLRAIRPPKAVESESEMLVASPGM